MRRVGVIALGPAAGNTVGIYGVISVPHGQRLFCSNLHSPWLTVIDAAKRAFAGVVRLDERVVCAGTAQCVRGQAGGLD
jgi:hypothetical protein